MIMKFFGGVLPIAALALGFATQAQTQALDLTGEQVTFYVPGSPGTGNDVYARTLAPYLERHLPGNPTLLVRNIPGSGNIAGMNAFETQAEPDGLHLLSVTISSVTNYVFRDPNVEYDLSALIPILLSPQGAVVYVSSSLGIEGPQDIAEMGDLNLISGGGNPTGSDIRMILMYDLLGWNVTNVWGLSRGNARQAFERQEFNLNYDSAPAYLGSAIELVNSGMAVPLFTLGVISEAGEVVRDPNFPDLPHFLEVYEMVHGEPLDGVEYEAWRVLMQMATMTNKFLALPAGTPDDIVATYVEAVRNILNDPEAQAGASEIFGNYQQFVGDAGGPIIRGAIEVSDESWTFLDGWLQANHGASLGASSGD